MPLVFVYGTLRLNASNAADTFVGAEYSHSDAIDGSIYNLGWYPGLILDNGGIVTGDVFAVTQEQLSRLDEYEGAPNLYSRKRVTTHGGVEVFVYEYNGSVQSDERIPSGDWLDFTEEVI